MVERLVCWLEALEVATGAREWATATEVVTAIAHLHVEACRATGSAAGASLRRLRTAGYVESRGGERQTRLEWRLSEKGCRVLAERRGASTLRTATLTRPGP